MVFIPLQTVFVEGYTVFMAIRPSVRANIQGSGAILAIIMRYFEVYSI